MRIAGIEQPGWSFNRACGILDFGERVWFSVFIHFFVAAPDSAYEKVAKRNKFQQKPPPTRHPPVVEPSYRRHAGES